MATAVIQRYAASNPPRRISRVASEPPLQTSSLQNPTAHAAGSQGDGQDPLIVQLGQLASQHHKSEYNILKFGPNGSPLVYVPYSMQMPDHYKEMQARQSQCSKQRVWWPHKKKASVEEDNITPPPPYLPCHGGVNHGSMIETPAAMASVLDLREQLSAAISSSIILPYSTVDRHATAQPTSQAHWHTSETHPIVISTIVPSELLPAVSSGLSRATERSPVVFDVPSSQLLHRIIPTPTLPLPHISLPSPPNNPSRPSQQLSPTQALAKSFRLSNLFWVHPTVRRAFLGNADLPQPVSKKRSRPASFVAPRSPPHLGIPVAQLRPKITRDSSYPSVLEREEGEEVSRSHAMPTPNSGTSVYSAAFLGMSIPAVPAIPPAATVRLLGNLYMSSCPGKKVRLGGPVRGRNTVCRDLRTDLTRIKSIGVACIICCLDDSELESLGVSWPDYAYIADELQIDVLRIPIPEGLAPLNAAMLDAHLTHLIDSYTLRGSPILVHCRGGVGRAGIIACCWMLKLGLCGWLEPCLVDAAFVERPDDAAHSIGGPHAVREDVMHLIERLISVVRRRRSPKAVETYEQVKFLVEFVEYLQDRASREISLLDTFTDWDTEVE